MPSGNNRDSDILDVVIVGAGFAGLYALHQLRGMGLRTTVLEASDEIGGTWNWNRYPGARCDVQSLIYCYMFDKALHASWTWSERYATQDEILRYIRHVADYLELSPDIALQSQVSRAEFDDDANLWTVTTEEGRSYTARWLIMATGPLSVGQWPDIPGIEQFTGEAYHTSTWPRDAVDFTGKRVAVIGTGSSGVQIIPEIARDAASLTVYQRTPNFVAPARNRPMSLAESQSFLDQFDEMRRSIRAGELVGTGEILAPPDFPPTVPSATSLSQAERDTLLGQRWAIGGVTIARTFGDTMTNEVTNSIVADFIRNRIREAVNDPVTAEKLIPTGYPFGSKRICVGTDYYETYNRQNVELVDLLNDPIDRFEANGIRSQSGICRQFDVIICATGFDAVTGALTRIDIRGRNGIALKDSWAKGPAAYLGLAVRGFPNLFTICGPGSPGALSVVTVSIEQHVDWITDFLSFLRARNIDRFEPTEVAQSEWAETSARAVEGTLLANGKSWFCGDNVPGKPRIFLAYVGGVGRYREICDQVAAEGYRGFELGGRR